MKVQVISGGPKYKGPLVRYKGRYVCTINKADHFNTTRPGGRYFSPENIGIREALGRALELDIVKQVWAVMDNVGAWYVY